MSSGMRWAETTRASNATPNCWKMAAACCMVSQSLLDPMTTPTWTLLLDMATPGENPVILENRTLPT